MRIVQEGRPQRGWAKEYACTGRGNGDGGCGAVLLVERGDLFRTERHSIGEGPDLFVTFECAACTVWTDITEGAPVCPAELELRVRKAKR